LIPVNAPIRQANIGGEHKGSGGVSKGAARIDPAIVALRSR
jgi:hypothetical protein